MQQSSHLPKILPPSPPAPLPPSRGWLGFWFALAAPPRPEEELTSALQREELRKAELTSIFLLAFALVGTLGLPVVFLNLPQSVIPSAVVGYLVFYVLVVLIAWLNRRGAIRTAASLLVTVLMVAIALRTTPLFGSDQQTAQFLLPDYDSFAFGILLSTLILPRRFIVPFAVLALGYVIVDFLAFPHCTNGVCLQTSNSDSFSILFHAGLLLLTLAIGGWLVSRSVEQTVIRADRAEELVAAERRIADQTRLLSEQKTRLEAGIAQILETHRRVAAGDFSACAPLQEDNELWQIGRSLNILLARYATLAQESQEMAQTSAEIDQIAGAVEHARYTQHLQLPACHTPLAQRLMFALGAG